MRAITAIGLAAALAGLAGCGGSRAREPAIRHPPPPRAIASLRPLTGAALDENRVARILRRTSYISHGEPRRDEVALTFDDGPSRWTPKVLAILRRFGVRATFFEMGKEVRAFPRITALVHRDGMLIGDHTETHPAMARLDAAEQAAQLDAAADAIERAGAPRPVLFRPPYGSFDSTTLELLRRRDMLMCLWSVDTSDYERPGAARIRYTALSGARAGSIILMHDGGGDRSQTVAALPGIIAKLQRRGLHLVTVAQLLHDDPPPRGQPPPRNLMGG